MICILAEFKRTYNLIFYPRQSKPIICRERRKKKVNYQEFTELMILSGVAYAIIVYRVNVSDAILFIFVLYNLFIKLFI